MHILSVLSVPLFYLCAVAFMAGDVGAWRCRRPEIPWWHIAGKLHLFEPDFYTDEGNRRRVKVLGLAAAALGALSLAVYTGH